MSIDAVGVPEAPFDCRTQVTTSMEDFDLYNQGYKALSLLITILAGAVICRLLSRDTLGIGSTVSYSNTCAGKKLSAKHTVKLVTGCQPGKVSQLRLA